MAYYRYSRWDGIQKFNLPDPSSLMDKMADGLIQGGDLMRAIRMLIQNGAEGPEGFKGLQSLLEKLRRLKKRELDRYNPDTTLQQIKDKLEAIVAKERKALRGPRSEEEGGTGPVSPQQAQEKLDYLSSLPREIGEKIEGLRDYEFVDEEARKEFRELLEMLQQKALETFFHNVKKQLEEITWEKAQKLKDMLRDLNRMFREKAEGTEPDFQEFSRKHGQQFHMPGVKDFQQFIRAMQRSLGLMTSLLESMSHEMRKELSRLLQSSIYDEEFRQQLQELMEHLRSQPGFVELVNRYPFKGKETLNLNEALNLMERLQNIQELEKSLQKAWRSSELGDIDREKMRELLGEESLRDLDNLDAIADLLEDAGYIRKSGEGLELTPKGIRRIGFKAMTDIFSTLKKGRSGHHQTVHTGHGGDPVEDTRKYQFGDPFSVHIEKTLINAMIRGGRGRAKITIEPADFEVYMTEYLSHSATVIMLDMSGSMETFDRFSAAKKVAIALENLIGTHFPKDTLHIVGFYTHAREIKKGELPFLQPKPFGYNPYLPVDYFSMQWGHLNMEIDQRDINEGHSNVPESFTNIQQGLRCSAKLLAKESSPNKQIIMITDGEPTAHSEEGKLHLHYPPSQRTIVETLKEVQRCTRQGITINTFMLNRDHYLEKFVEEITRINRGRAFFTTPDKIGQYIFVDYMRMKRKKIA